MAIIRNEEVILPQGEINERALVNCILEHEKTIPRLDKLKAYYDGAHAILNRTMRINDSPNNKVLVNHAEYITDFAVGYFIGNPIAYDLEADNPLKQMLDRGNLETVDTELSREISIYGLGYELIFQNKKGQTKSTNIDPRNCFVIVDDTVEYNTLLGVHYYDRKDENNNVLGKTVNVYSPTFQKTYFYKSGTLVFEKEQEVIYGAVPIIEYWNKSNQKGDFEGVIGLIDAYNKLQSDRVNDKEQFVQSLLVIYGTLAGDDSEERLATVRAFKKEGLLEMPQDARAEFINKSLNEGDTETLRKSIENDIHKVCKVPNLTDEHFASNASGVAMGYKLLGLEQLTQTKENYYRMGVRERLAIYTSVLSKRLINVEVEDIKFEFKRSLPNNNLELSQVIANLRDFVSDGTLLTQIPFVDNPQEELERVKEQKEENLKANQEMIGSYEQEDTVDE